MKHHILPNHRIPDCVANHLDPNHAARRHCSRDFIFDWDDPRPIQIPLPPPLTAMAFSISQSCSSSWLIHHILAALDSDQRRLCRSCHQLARHSWPVRWQVEATIRRFAGPAFFSFSVTGRLWRDKSILPYFTLQSFLYKQLYNTVNTRILPSSKHRLHNIPTPSSTLLIYS